MFVRARHPPTGEPVRLSIRHLCPTGLVSVEPAERSDGARAARSGGEEWTRRSKAEARDAPLAEKPEDPLEQPERAQRVMVRKGGLEPPRYCYRQPLKLVRL